MIANLTRPLFGYWMRASWWEGNPERCIVEFYKFRVWRDKAVARQEELGFEVHPFEFKLPNPAKT